MVWMGTSGRTDRGVVASRNGSRGAHAGCGHRHGATCPVPPTLATDPRARKIYWSAVVVEVVLILLGVFVLSGTGNAVYTSTWVLFVVGVHFLPFVRPFSAPILRYTALGCVVAAAVALWAGLAGWAPAPTIAGAGGGVVLLGSALVLAVTAKRHVVSAPSSAAS